MMAILDITSPYVRRARLQPALIVALPLGLAVISWSQNGFKALAVLWSLFVWVGGTALMAQIARDRGRRKEAELFQLWGGKPTTRLLRYVGTENAALVNRRHTLLQKALPDLVLPSAQTEAVDPKGADDVYETCVRWLLEQTRDKKKYGHLFDENCNYGFRRNLWGMKPLALAIGLVSLGFGCAIIANHLYSHTQIMPVTWGAIAGIVALLAFWIGWCNSSWVKVAADAYAERLLAASETLQTARKSPRKESSKPRSARGKHLEQEK